MLALVFMLPLLLAQLGDLSGLLAFAMWIGPLVQNKTFMKAKRYQVG
jgi:hypothetical protein